jgi:uncharacterized protein (DUF924 family)
MRKADEILEFWTGVGPEGWYGGGAALDAEIAARFGDLWSHAPEALSWTHDMRGALAFILLTDQFPRNMFRTDARAFATDHLGLAVAARAIRMGWDQGIGGGMRQFFYLPFMHSELRADQDLCVAFFTVRMPGTDNLRHARAHREIIRRFGRFPYRNAALGRETTPQEAEFLARGGYASVLNGLA